VLTLAPDASASKLRKGAAFNVRKRSIIDLLQNSIRIENLPRHRAVLTAIARLSCHYCTTVTGKVNSGNIARLKRCLQTRAGKWLRKNLGLKNLKSPKFRVFIFFGQILYRSYLISYFSRVSFVIFYRKRYDTENGV